MISLASEKDDTQIFEVLHILKTHKGRERNIIKNQKWKEGYYYKNTEIQRVTSNYFENLFDTNKKSWRNG